MPVSEDPTIEPADAQIVATSLRDPTQFALIFDRHYGPVRGYLERRAGRALAEELAGETFYRRLLAEILMTGSVPTHVRGCWASPPI
jgi:hypothetical protein